MRTRRVHDVGEHRVRVELHGVQVGAAGLTRAAVRRDAGIVDEVLVQRAAASDVQHLEAAADGEERQTACDGDVRERGFEVVGPAIDAVHGRVRRFAVQRRVDVGAAGEHERVDTCEQRLRVAGVVDEHRLCARALDRVEVRTGQRGRARVRPAIGAAEPAPGQGHDHHVATTTDRSCGAVPSR